MSSHIPCKPNMLTVNIWKKQEKIFKQAANKTKQMNGFANYTAKPNWVVSNYKSTIPPHSFIFSKNTQVSFPFCTLGCKQKPSNSQVCSYWNLHKQKPNTNAKITVKGKKINTHSLSQLNKVWNTLSSWQLVSALALYCHGTEIGIQSAAWYRNGFSGLLLGVAKLRRMMVGISMSFGFFFFFSFSFLVSENSCISFGRWLMVITIMTHLVGGLWYFHKFH